jgi:hypothetical protein
MRVDNILGIFTALLLFVAWWFFMDPASASHHIEGLVAASKIWRS